MNNQSKGSIAIKKTLLLISALMFFTSTFLVIISVPQASAQSGLPSYTISKTGACNIPNIHQSGNVYTLTSNIEGSIQIERDRVVLDGAGFTIQGNGKSDSLGIEVTDGHNITIKNLQVKNYEWGIVFSHNASLFFWDFNPDRTTNCTISNCQISNDTLGIAIYGGRNCSILDNSISDCRTGITYSGSGNTFRNNKMQNSDINFSENAYDPSNSVDTSNTVNGKPIYYITNKHDITVPTDVGMVVIQECSNILIQNLDISNVYTAIGISNSSNCKIINNTITHNNRGVYIRLSTNNTIKTNQITNNSGSAIEADSTDKTAISNNLIWGNGGGVDLRPYGTFSGASTIFNNQIMENTDHGIRVGTRCNITGNYVANNGQDGIYFYTYNVSDNIINRNIIQENGGSGIVFPAGKYASISCNNITRNGIMGIWIGEPLECNITGNNFAQNAKLAIQIESKAENNTFVHNNFINNNNGSAQVSIKIAKGPNSYWVPQLTAGYPNAWDNGAEGNYWSDNSTATTYKIDHNNIDNHPMSEPFQFTQLDIPKAGLETPQPTLQFGVEGGFLLIVAVLVAIAVAVVAAALLVKRRRERE
jgi:parallel beta-helix repeat protein